MRSLHLTILLFCQILLASFILYSTITSASPVVQPISHPASPAESKVQKVEYVEKSKPTPVASNNPSNPSHVDQNQVAVSKQQQEVIFTKAQASSEQMEPVVSPRMVEKFISAVQKEAKIVAAAPAVNPQSAQLIYQEVSKVPVIESPVKLMSDELKQSPVVIQVKEEPVVRQQEKVVPVVAPIVVEVAPRGAAKKQFDSVESQNALKQAVVAKSPSVVTNENLEKVVNDKLKEKKIPVSVVEKQPIVEQVKRVDSAPEQAPIAPVSQDVVVQKVVSQKVSVEPVVAKEAPIKEQQPVEPSAIVVLQQVVVPNKPVAVQQPIVKGGLGPLHLLASSLCSYQPEKLVADETLNLLYKERASIRKSLFDFMSLKFTNLEKLSSRLSPGYASLEVVPRKTVDQANPGVVPSHGWPVVGKCTAHDLKLMAEAAWCDSALTPPVSNPAPAQALIQQQASSVESSDKQLPLSSKQNRAQAARAVQQVASVEQSAVVSKILHVNDVKDAPVIDSSLVNLNLTQQQLASIQAQATSTRECRRNALRLTKALFNHLAEDQKYESDSWPKLYSLMADDECARKRMIDVVTALAGFRGESTSIRRDNMEYAFAMDDLRTKVLESEVNVPLTFDKQFIEVEQFLQQSVKLMLANIDPGRARLTSMRYRSLMPGPVAADDQCIELHQRLLAKNYPTDCNPTQFGQLPDVLRMTASSLALWSIEAELNKYSSRIQEFPSASVIVQPQVKQDVNECIANLVTS